MARHYSVLCPLIMLTPLPRPITQRVNRKDVFKSCIKLFRFPARLRSPVNQVWSSLKKIQWLATAARWTTPSIFRISIFFLWSKFLQGFSKFTIAALLYHFIHFTGDMPHTNSQFVSWWGALLFKISTVCCWSFYDDHPSRLTHLEYQR